APGVWDFCYRCGMPKGAAADSPRHSLNRRSLLIGAGLSLIAVSRFSWGQPQQRQVDLALALAADCSGSVHAEHYMLQQRGYAEAFRSREVKQAIRSGIHGAIAVAYYQWSGYTLQNLLLPWTVLGSDDEIMRFAARMEQAERTIFGGGTSPSGAIEFGHALLSNLPVQTARRVIDISGDGRNNTGPPPAAARKAALDAGIVINGLPILHMEPDIDEYYEKFIIGGPGAFLVPARDYSSFAAAVRRKLVLEIAGRDGPAILKG
ncbi:MAG: DUF1194 domain-containing protein, partial [Ferrovibrio sp.]